MKIYLLHDWISKGTYYMHPATLEFLLWCHFRQLHICVTFNLALILQMAFSWLWDVKVSFDFVLYQSLNTVVRCHCCCCVCRRRRFFPTCLFHYHSLLFVWCHRFIKMFRFDQMSLLKNNLAILRINTILFLSIFSLKTLITRYKLKSRFEDTLPDMILCKRLNKHNHLSIPFFVKITRLQCKCYVT